MSSISPVTITPLPQPPRQAGAASANPQSPSAASQEGGKINPSTQPVRGHRLDLTV